MIILGAAETGFSLRQQLRKKKSNFFFAHAHVADRDMSKSSHRGFARNPLPVELHPALNRLTPERGKTSLPFSSSEVIELRNTIPSFGLLRLKSSANTVDGGGLPKLSHNRSWQIRIIFARIVKFYLVSIRGKQLLPFGGVVLMRRRKEGKVGLVQIQCHDAVLGNVPSAVIGNDTLLKFSLYEDTTREELRDTNTGR